MAGSGNNIQLLLSCKVDEFNGISGYTDCEVCILFFFRMFHSINQFFFTEYVNIEVMSTLIKVSVKHTNKVLCTFFFCMSQSIMFDGLSIGDTASDRLSDRGSIPLRSILWHQKADAHLSKPTEMCVSFLLSFVLLNM